MPAPLPPLTLIVAATRTAGIGAGGVLPWRLKDEMAYFARITKRAPPPFTRNAVIMGRHTWESIPERFRPLADRINVVLSRSPASLDVGPDVVAAASIADGIAAARERAPDGHLARVFVMGGAEVYRAALVLPEARNVLLTRVLSDFECDTFFPIKLDEADDGGDAAWEKRSWEELCAFVGEEVPRGVQEEDGVRYEFELWTNRKYTARSSMQM